MYETHLKIHCKFSHAQYHTSVIVLNLQMAWCVNKKLQMFCLYNLTTMCLTCPMTEYAFRGTMNRSTKQSIAVLCDNCVGNEVYDF